jgi:hypothetical protein
MDKSSKLIQLPNGEKMVIPKAARYFTINEKHHLIQAYLSGKVSKSQVWKKYTGKTDHGRLLKWMRQLGYAPQMSQKKATFVDKQTTMLPDHNLPTQQLQQAVAPASQDQQTKIKALEHELELAQEKLGLTQKELGTTKKELELAQVKAIAYSTMIDLAEKEFNIPIRKK